VKIHLLCVGKPRLDEAVRLHDDYARRLRQLGWTYVASHVSEERAGGRFTDEHVKEREARSLLERLEKEPGKPHRIALHPEGELIGSRELATRLERWSRPAATFVVGGPLGLHSRLTERCDSRWSLSRLTFPHELVRLLVAEQLYRAATILRGIPYHK
jgi:23S rRNA (pseudouridine1915-N3)-methyltransferase